MSLSTDVIFDRLNEYFITRFGMTGNVQTLFRFQKWGSGISDQDAIDPDQPGLGYQHARAVEAVSTLADHVPNLSGDNLSLSLNLQSSTADRYYSELLRDSEPYVVVGADEQSADFFTRAFTSMKAEAIRRWTNAPLEAHSGVPMRFKPVLATPDAWYDPARKDLWSNASFEVSADMEGFPSPQEPGIWRIAPSQPVLALHQAEPPSDGTTSALAAAIRMAREYPDAVSVTTEDSSDGESRVAVSSDEVQRLRLEDRLLLEELLATQVQTVSTAVNTATIAFDYCVVQINRPWWYDIFVNDGTWYVPGTAACALTLDDSSKGMPFVTSGMVLVRNLLISGSWEQIDVESAQRAMSSFGPFNVDSGVADGQLAYPHVQTIGWPGVRSVPSAPPPPPAARLAPTPPQRRSR
ncbi:hypothetical protein ACFWBV_12940 [Streptomyces sp. NPDC060030]|uniref:hypothetical protein n=1 Tax=Streptomyces sp. NPDC060030 TaxID=3347042 RepID=UPI0036BD80F5